MNKIIITGNLTKKPELYKTSSGVAHTSFTVAVQRKFANAQGEKETDFLNVKVWRGLAENCVKFLDKGKKVAIVGSLQTGSYEKTDGTKAYTTDIIADEVEFLSTASAKPTEQTDYEEIDDGELPF